MLTVLRRVRCVRHTSNKIDMFRIVRAVESAVVEHPVHVIMALCLKAHIHKQKKNTTQNYSFQTPTEDPVVACKYI